MTAPIFNVHYNYFVDGKHRAKGYAVVIAETAEEADIAFRAVHPDGANFEYRVNKIIIDPLHFRRLDVEAAFGRS